MVNFLKIKAGAKEHYEENSVNIFQELLIWKTIDDKSAVRYFCFFNLTTKKYCVQSADFFNLPIEEKQVHYFARQSIELFVESPPNERCGWFESLLEAIEDHDDSFNTLPGHPPQ